MAHLLPIHPFPDGSIFKSWWQWVLVAIIGAGVVTGLITVLWAIIAALLRRRKKDSSFTSPLPSRVKSRIGYLATNSPPLGFRTRIEDLPQPQSFGVYLGRFTFPLKASQLQVLEQWDLLIVDPTKGGVVDALAATNGEGRRHVVGRLDFRYIVGAPSIATEKTMLDTLQRVMNFVHAVYGAPGAAEYFSGILLAGWYGLLPTPLLNAVVWLLSRLGLDVYLEIAPPEFLEDMRIPDMSLFAGVVVRNATILSDGERRDFFAMDKMKSTVKAFVSQSCMRPFTVMMWETVEDGVELQHAVVKRSFSWCNYYRALSWRGPAAALTDAAANLPVLEPLAAFHWLKELKVMNMHETYRATRLLSHRPVAKPDDYRSLQTVFPSMRLILSAVAEDQIVSDASSVSTLALHSPEFDASGKALSSMDGETLDNRNGLEWMTGITKSAANPMSCSPMGVDYTSLGCFALGIDVKPDDFTRVVKSLRRLRRLNLLDQVPSSTVREYGSTLQAFLASEPQLSPSTTRAVRDLSDQFNRASDMDQLSDPVQIFLGLDSGFHASSTSQFWSVYETDRKTGSLIIYVSKNAQGLLSTVLHSYLSNWSLSRYHRYLCEVELVQFTDPAPEKRLILDRLEQDLNILSPADLLLLMQHLKFSQWDESCPLIRSVLAACEELLLDVPSFQQLKRLGNVDYIGGTVSAADLVSARVTWYRVHGCPHLELDAAAEVFTDIDLAFRDILRDRLYDQLDIITASLDSIISSGNALGSKPALDAFADFVAFSVFCAARKAAFEEVYVEVSDRNPLFNEFSDQSAAFAELFALGSRCESYFDVTPSEFGKLLSDKHRTYYNKSENQPPMWIDNAPAFASAYAAAQTDIDPEQKDEALPAYRRFTFLSVFAIPALVDIMLLTTTGHGLYLSAHMTKDEQRFATLALMVSLLLSGAIGTWISIGGTYYLISMAFSAANMFVLTRLIGGLAFTFLAALIGFIVISAVIQVQLGAIFFFYLLVLTTYLSVLAALSTFQFPGSSFLNGRTVIISIIPTLAISPIVTILAPGHDSVVYLWILFGFVTLLILGLRYVTAQWVTWITTIKTIEDKDVKDWYVRVKAGGREDAFAGLTDPGAMNLSRINLYADVEIERKRRFWNKSNADPLVRELADCWDATLFLLNWYCRLSDVKRPMPYSSTWNIEVRVAYDSLLQNQKGIRLHNSFIHWRTAGDEIGCGILYFLVALMDRWIQLLFGDQVLSLGFGFDPRASERRNNALRVAVGFGLAYYLIGAVLLDYKAQHLHQMAQKTSPMTVRDSNMIREATKRDARFKQRLYWTTLARFLGVHVWALSVSATMVWVFGGEEISLVIFLAYVGAYSGLLLYQYNKIFSGPHALMPLLAAVAIGLPLGCLLRGLLPHFQYDGVIALAVSTWTAAFMSLYTANMGLPKRRMRLSNNSNRTFHAYCGLGIDQKWSQSELESFYDAILSGPAERRFYISAGNHPGTEIKSLLLSCNYHTLSAAALDAFPNAPDMISQIMAAWDQGYVGVELVAMSSVISPEADIRAISCCHEGRLHLLIASDCNQSPGAQNISSNCRVIAETMLHACSETFVGLNHDQASITESLLVCRVNNDDNYQVSECLKRAIPFEITELKMNELAALSRRQILDNLCLGLPCDTIWDDMPLDIRRTLLQRCLGEFSPFSSSEIQWLESHIDAEEDCNLSTRVARYDLAALLAVLRYNYFKIHGPMRLGEKSYQQKTANIQYSGKRQSGSYAKSTLHELWLRIKSPFSVLYHALGMWIKFTVIAPIGDPEYQRELNCMLARRPKIIAIIARFLLTGLWRYSQIVQAAILPVFLFHGRRHLKSLLQAIKGTVITLKKGRLTISGYEKQSTGFLAFNKDGGFKMTFYKGILDIEPSQGKPTYVNTYHKDLRLLARTELANGEMINEFIYHYPSKKEKRMSKLTRVRNPKIPSSRVCVRGKDESAVVNYNNKGFIESGSYLYHGNLIRFNYHYRKNAKFEDELLRAEFVLPHMSANVSWAAPPIRHPEKPERWIPHSRVNEATFVTGGDVYECVWVYNHQYHPTIITKLNGHPSDTPEMIRHDWLGLLKKPSSCTFGDDNPLLDFISLKGGFIPNLMGVNTKRLPASTSRKRSQLWKTWKQRTDLDGVVMRWLDEVLLRDDAMLKPYWRRRDRGALTKAEDYLALHADAITASSELSNDISPWTSLAIRLSDLFSFGQGGDAVIYTRTKTLQPDTNNTLHVVAVDTGTWPNEGGGVSACRRDLINNLRTIKWHMVVESANDFGIPKHQTEENVESLKVVPLWGLDFMHPVHGMFFNKLDSEVDHLIKGATRADIKRNFIPTLTALVKGARAVHHTQADIEQSTRALITLNDYFQNSRHWKEVWESDIVKETWRELWLAEDIPNTKPPSEWFLTEHPTLGHLDSALELWFRYLFIFSIPIPERIPHVFQASHHSVSAAYGIVCKLKRKSVLQIWDHAISWRETNLYLSSALCTLPPFIRNSLLGLMRLTSTLILHHADHILPCADFFNPGWEVEIGTSQGMLRHRKIFRRKIDPIVNGITDMQKFAPVTEIKTQKPTVTMLSHVWFAKDIKTALLAADIIVNEWGFDEYQLDIYGALNKAPIYSSECQEIIATKGIGTNVSLRGTADPGLVLANTWLFLNSSVSEGLPLALGEAALTGAPVVCTDVGASLRVLTNPESGERFSEIVAPNDPYSLARAQINLLAMLDQWTKFAGDDPSTPAPVLPHKPGPEDVRIITQRMYEKSSERRALGMMARSIVQKSFSGERYLREHEQMLWIGKARYESYGITEVALKEEELQSGLRGPAKTYADVVDAQIDKMKHPRPPWLRDKHASMMSSFTSMYDSESPGDFVSGDSSDWQSGPGTGVQSPSSPGSRPSRSRKTSIRSGRSSVNADGYFALPQQQGGALSPTGALSPNGAVSPVGHRSRSRSSSMRHSAPVSPRVKSTSPGTSPALGPAGMRASLPAPHQFDLDLNAYGTPRPDRSSLGQQRPTATRASSRVSDRQSRYVPSMLSEVYNAHT